MRPDVAEVDRVARRRTPLRVPLVGGGAHLGHEAQPQRGRVAVTTDERLQQPGNNTHHNLVFIETVASTCKHVLLAKGWQLMILMYKRPWYSVDIFDIRQLGSVETWQFSAIFKFFTLWPLSTNIRHWYIQSFLYILLKSVRYLIEIWSIFSWYPFIKPLISWYPVHIFPARSYPLGLAVWPKPGGEHENILLWHIRDGRHQCKTRFEPTTSRFVIQSNCISAKAVEK